MNTLTLEHDPLAVALSFTDKIMTVELADGRSLSVPISWYPRLYHATTAERANWRLLGNGYAIEWPNLDEHVSLTGLLAGNRSGESHVSFNRWLATRSGG